MVAFERVEYNARWSTWFVKNVDWSKEHMAEVTCYPARKWNGIIIAVLFEEGTMD